MSILFSVSIVIKLDVLILEECGKRRQTVPGGEVRWSKEETAGIFGRTLFSWLNRFMWAGYSGALSVANLPNIDQQAPVRVVVEARQPHV